MASSDEFIAAVTFALSSVNQEHLVLRQKQLEVLQKLYSGYDVFVRFPTGYGKSLCYQLLPYMFDVKLGRSNAPSSARSVVLVISPLVSLMIDQVSSLLNRGVPAGILTGNKGLLS